MRRLVSRPQFTGLESIFFNEAAGLQAEKEPDTITGAQPPVEQDPVRGLRLDFARKDDSDLKRRKEKLNGEEGERKKCKRSGKFF